MRAVDCGRAASVGLSLALSACTPATLSVSAEPADSRILIDSVPQGVGSVTVRRPYYGVARVEAVPPPAQPPKPSRRPVQKMVRLDPPITSWIFPFDLLFEISTYPWREHDTKVDLQTEPRDVPAQHEHPPIEELRSRAIQSLTGR